METNANLGWQILGFGLMVAGAVIVANKSPNVWNGFYAGALELVRG